MVAAAGGEASSQLGWGVGSVAARLGIAASTLRTWERRYDVGPSRRTAGGHRRYSETDIDRVMLTQLLIARGAPARDAAQLAHGLDAAGLAQALTSEQGVVEGEQLAVGDLPAAVVQAAAAADSERIGRMLSDALRRYGAVAAWSDVIAPSLIDIGHEWSQGRLSIEAEHVASEVIAGELRAHTRGMDGVDRTGRPVVLASAEDDPHSLPVFALEAALAEAGVGALVMGARLPAHSLAGIVERRNPRVVFLWASLPRPADEELWHVLETVGRQTAVILAGPGWPEETQHRLHDAGMLWSTDLQSTVDHIVGASDE